MEWQRKESTKSKSLLRKFDQRFPTLHAINETGMSDIYKYVNIVKKDDYRCGATFSFQTWEKFRAFMNEATETDITNHFTFTKEAFFHD